VDEHPSLLFTIISPCLYGSWGLAGSTLSAVYGYKAELSLTNRSDDEAGRVT